MSLTDGKPQRLTLKREIIRCLKRSVAREIYRQIHPTSASTAGRRAFLHTCGGRPRHRPVPAPRRVDQVERAIFQWVTWYNEERLHSALNYVPPAEYERDWWRQQKATPQSA